MKAYAYLCPIGEHLSLKEYCDDHDVLCSDIAFTVWIEKKPKQEIR